MTDIEGDAVEATDGVIGQVRDIYFDDEAWVIRYFVVQAGDWLSNRRVLISPISIAQPNGAEKRLSATISRQQVRHSPDVDTHKPVSRQQEIGFLGYYSYPCYWGKGRNQGTPGDFEAEHNMHQSGDPHLRSGNAVERYYVHASDGDIGHVQGFLIDDQCWAIRYLIVNTSNWWAGHQVIIAPEWIDDVNWLDSKVSVDLTRQAVKNSPSYDEAPSSAPLSPVLQVLSVQTRQS